MVVVPDPITVNTGEQENVQERIDRFFGDVRAEVRDSYLLNDRLFEIRSRELVNEGGQIVDDKVTELRYKDLVLAGVFEYRSDLNNVNYIFFRGSNSRFEF